MQIQASSLVQPGLSYVSVKNISKSAESVSVVHFELYTFI